MDDQNGNNVCNKIGAWFGNIANLAALFAIIIIVKGIFDDKVNTMVLIVAFGTLILMVFLKYADVSRFIGTVSSDGTVPPLGLAKGSIRALLAFSILLGFGLYILYALDEFGEVDDKIFTALLTILSSVTGFYFGSRGTAAPPPESSTTPLSDGKSPKLEIIGIDPTKGKSGEKDSIIILTGTGFQEKTTASLERGQNKIIVKEVLNISQDSKITCLFDLSNAESGKWNVVVTNPDTQSFILKEGFEIEKL